MTVPFKEKLDLGDYNPANDLDNLVYMKPHSLQSDPAFQVYYFRPDNPFAEQVNDLLASGVGLVSWQSPQADFLDKMQAVLPQKGGKIVLNNDQGSQPSHSDNTQPGDPRHYNMFMNMASRDGYTFIKARELFHLYYESHYKPLIAEVRGRAKDTLVGEIDTYTPIEAKYYQAFLENRLDLSDRLGHYWLIEIVAKLYRRQHYLKKEFDALYADQLKRYPELTHVQDWRSPGGVVHNNTETLHCRYTPMTDVVPEDQLKSIIRIWLGREQSNLISALMETAEEGQGILSEPALSQ